MWQAQFPKQQPLRLELGCGKGGFISQEALANPDYNYIAVDIKNEKMCIRDRVRVSKQRRKQSIVSVKWECRHESCI